MRRLRRRHPERAKDARRGGASNDGAYGVRPWRSGMMIEKEAAPRDKLVLERGVVRELRVRSDVRTGRASKSLSALCPVSSACAAIVFVV